MIADNFEVPSFASYFNSIVTNPIHLRKEKNVCVCVFCCHVHNLIYSVSKDEVEIDIYINSLLSHANTWDLQQYRAINNAKSNINLCLHASLRREMVSFVNRKIKPPFRRLEFSDQSVVVRFNTFLKCLTNIAIDR